MTLRLKTKMADLWEGQPVANYETRGFAFPKGEPVFSTKNEASIRLALLRWNIRA